MILVESWDPTELESLEKEANLRSFALDPAWVEAAVSSEYARPQILGVREAGSLRAACVGLRRSRAGLSKVVCGTNGGVGLIFADTRAAAVLIRGMLRRWQPSELQIFGPQNVPETSIDWGPCYTFHIDLRIQAENVLRNFKKQTRHGLRQALERGVTAATAVGSEVEEAFDLIASTANEKRFRLPPRRYLAALHQSFARSGLSEVIVAKQDDSLLAAVHVLGARGVASWWKGGATPKGYSENASTVAMWTAIKAAADHGFETFDMGGTHPSDPKYQGIHRYKASFGGRLVQTFVGLRSTLVARTIRRLSSISL